MIKTFIIGATFVLSMVFPAVPESKTHVQKDSKIILPVAPPEIAHTPPPEPEPEPVAVPAPIPAPEPTCAGEIEKYSWNQSVAYKVMMAESGGNVQTQNNTPNTGDYSIGCFQINLKGSSNLLAKYRTAVSLGYSGSMTVAELEAWLKNAANNVAVAYKMWADEGWSPWSATTCRYKVRCY